MYVVFNRLVSVEQDSKTIKPDLATSWTVSPDAKTFTFQLAEGVKWQDGTPFTAEDVLFTANWTVQNLAAYTSFVPVWTKVVGAKEVQDNKADDLEGISAPDPNTVVITLAEPDALFLLKLAKTVNSIVPEHVLQNETAETIRKSKFATAAPIGTGPYQVTEIKPDQSVAMKANPEYFKGAPKIDDVYFMLYGASTAMTQLQTGDLDLAVDVDPTERAQLEQVQSLDVREITSASMTRLTLKNEAPPFDNKLVRQAAYYAIDRAGICEQVFDGLCDPLWVYTGFMGYSGLNDYAYDPAKAKSLLAESGVTNPNVRLMWDSGIAQNNVVFPIIAQYWEDAGFEVQQNPQPNSVYVDLLRFKRDAWETYVNAGGDEALSPDNSALYFNCAYVGDRGKWQSGYENCAVDELFADARQTADEVKRDSMYAELAKTLNEDVPELNLWQPKSLYVSSSKLGGGYTPSPLIDNLGANIETWTLGG